MPNRISNRAKYQLERWMLRGAGYRLLVIAAALGLLSLVAGLIVYVGTDDFDTAAQAVWWAFLRLTDPGYLGDDQGTVLRTVSTFLTVLGFVIFVGALVAILTQWLNRRMQELEEGHTPVSMRSHIVVLGWTNRTAAVVRELILSEERVARFLRLHGAGGLRIAILTDQVGPTLRRDLRDRLGARWSDRQIVLRSGSPLRLEHLRRVDFTNAAAIVVPGADFRHGSAESDTIVIKTLLSLTNHPLAAEGRRLPPVVAEIFDARKIPIARAAYGGSIELLASDAIISRLIVQYVRHAGLSAIYDELLTHSRGNAIYIRHCPELSGARLRDLERRFEHAVVLGIVREEGVTFRPILNPPVDYRVEPADRLVMLARSYADTAPGPPPAAPPSAPPPPVERVETPGRERTILILGWSHRVPALLQELASYREDRIRVDVMSAVPAAEREAQARRYDIGESEIQVRHVEGDYTTPVELRRLEPWSYQHVIVVGSDWVESGVTADARTILGYLLLREMLPASGGPGLLVELLDPENLPLLSGRPGQVLISPLILSHMIAQVALRPELGAVFDELCGAGGAEIAFRPAAQIATGGEALTFEEIAIRTEALGETALGVRLDGRVLLNPPRGQRWSAEELDEIVVLSTTG